MIQLPIDYVRINDVALNINTLRRTTTLLRRPRLSIQYKIYPVRPYLVRIGSLRSLLIYSSPKVPKDFGVSSKKV